MAGLILIIIGIIIISCVCLHKESKDVDQTSINYNLNSSDVMELPWIPEKDYPLYTFLDYSIKQVSYPNEQDRYYPVVKVTGHKLGSSAANIIIRYNGVTKKEIYEKERKKPKNYGLTTDDSFNLPTYDKVSILLNDYYKKKYTNFLDIKEPFPLNIIHYYRNKEDAAYALYQFKKRMDEFYNKKELSKQDISETDFKLEFTE